MRREDVLNVAPEDRRLKWLLDPHFQPSQEVHCLRSLPICRYRRANCNMLLLGDLALVHSSSAYRISVVHRIAVVQR